MFCDLFNTSINFKNLEKKICGSSEEDCHEFATCTDVGLGNHNCTCNRGYIGDGKTSCIGLKKSKLFILLQIIPYVPGWFAAIITVFVLDNVFFLHKRILKRNCHEIHILIIHKPSVIYSFSDIQYNYHFFKI